MNSPRPLWKSVQDYVLIAIGMISYAIGWNVFLLPTNVTASGLPGISSIIYWATGCPVQIPYFIVNATLLICAFKILGAKFCVKTVYAVIVVTILTSFFSSRLGDFHLLENQPLWAAFLGAVSVAAESVSVSRLVEVRVVRISSQPSSTSIATFL